MSAERAPMSPWVQPATFEARVDRPDDVRLRITVTMPVSAWAEITRFLKSADYRGSAQADDFAIRVEAAIQSVRESALLHSRTDPQQGGAS